MRVADALARTWATSTTRRRESVGRLGKLLDTLGYRNVLARGYALVRDANGQTVRSTAEIEANAVLDIQLADGHIDVLAVPRRTSPRRSRPKAEQGTLF